MTPAQEHYDREYNPLELKIIELTYKHELSEKDQAYIDENSDRLVRSCQRMGEAGARELLYKLGRFLNGSVRRN